MSNFIRQMELTNNKAIITNIMGEEILLLPQKALYWPKEKSLFIADLHLGKGNHFRKNGIAVPSSSQEKNWEKLKELFEIDGLEKVIFLGDLFHSSFNDDCLVFGEFIGNYPHINFELVIGNHDILDPKLYEEMGIKVHHQDLFVEPFLLTHEPIESTSEKYNLAGHIHPGVKLRGKGRQSIRAACFFFGEKNGLLPAFGSLTGLATLKVKKSDKVYLVLEDHVIEAQ